MTRIDHEMPGRDAPRAPDAALSDLTDEKGRTRRLAVGTLSRLELVVMDGQRQRGPLDVIRRIRRER